jgi:hypothetical protein
MMYVMGAVRGGFIKETVPPNGIPIVRGASGTQRDGGGENRG